MNPFGADSINIDGITVTLPSTSNGGSALSSNLTFQKPKWLPDAEVNVCPSCISKFTQLRRKHHCRNCGKIFCSKCCSEKIPLPHFGMPDPEKVCLDCKILVELMNKSKSDSLEEKYDAVIGLCDLIKTSSSFCKVIECGGLHSILHLAANGNIKIKKVVASALNIITQSMVLNHFLIEIGCLKLLKNFLISCYDCSEILSDSLSVLHLFCMDTNLRIQVLKEEIVDPLLNLVNSSGTIAVFASRVLLHLVSHFDYHEFILQKHPNIVAQLFNALKLEDYQMQNCVTKMLVYLSAGSHIFRELIIQEELDKEHPLLYLMKGTCESVLVNTACIVANVSLFLDQNSAPQYITALCDLLALVNDYDAEILGQLGRGLANFSECPSNTLCMIHHLPLILSKLLKSNFEIPKVHACRIINYLLSSETACTMDALSQTGMEEFIAVLFDLPDIKDVLNNLFMRKVSRLSVSQ